MKWLTATHCTPRIPGLSIRTRVNTGLGACSGSPDREEGIGSLKGSVKVREPRDRLSLKAL